MKLVAYDLGSPSLESEEAEAVISIGRNKYAPEFTDDDYAASIREDLRVGRGVITVRADDEDQTVSRERLGAE